MADSSREKIAKQLAHTLRTDLHLLSNEAKRKHPAVKEVRYIGRFFEVHLGNNARIEWLVCGAVIVYRG